MRFYARTSKRTGVSFGGFSLLLLVFVWPLFIIAAVWKFVGDKRFPAGLRFVVGFAFFVFVFLVASGQIH
jgi:hypothetical protein